MGISVVRASGHVILITYRKGDGGGVGWEVGGVNEVLDRLCRQGVLIDCVDRVYCYRGSYRGNGRSDQCFRRCF